MNPDDKYIRRGKIILSISMLLLITAIGLFIVRNTNLSSKDFTLTYETIDINDKTFILVHAGLNNFSKIYSLWNHTQPAASRNVSTSGIQQFFH